MFGKLNVPQRASHWRPAVAHPGGKVWTTQTLRVVRVVSGTPGPTTRLYICGLDLEKLFLTPFLSGMMESFAIIVILEGHCETFTSAWCFYFHNELVKSKESLRNVIS